MILLCMIQKGARHVVDLIAKTPADGMLPIAHGGVELAELALGKATSIAPFKGQSEAVEAALGVKLPKVGRAGADIFWFSQGQYFALGRDMPAGLERIAAITDQSDAWCALSISGEPAQEVLARLVPIDLRQTSFKRGHCARTQLGHMPLHITRIGNDAFRLLSFRSMAGTMVHEITRAMELFAARG